MDDFTPDSNPAFLDPLRANALEYVGDPSATSTFDREIQPAVAQSPAAEPQNTVIEGPSPGYEERWRAIARSHALGKTNNTIANEMQYTPAALSTLLKHPWIQQEVARYRKMFDADIVTRVKEAAVDGIARIHRIINDEHEKTSTVLDASKWAVEKASGKARQEIAVEQNYTFYLGILKDMERRGETLDVTPRKPAPAELAAPQGTASDQWEAWLDNNLD